MLNVAAPAIGVAAATSFPKSFPIPAMPCVACTAQEHRQKNVSADAFYGALIARSLSKKEMRANSDAYKALKDEADTFANPKRRVWLMDSVTERWQVKGRHKDSLRKAVWLCGAKRK